MTKALIRTIYIFPVVIMSQFSSPYCYSSSTLHLLPHNILQQDGLHVIAEFSCVLRNQRGKVVFTTNKSMLYDKAAPDASNSGLPPLPSPSLSNGRHKNESNARVAPAGSYARSPAASLSSYPSHYDDESVGSPQVCACV